MKRMRPKRRGGLTSDVEQLARFARGLAESGSRAEDRFWELELGTAVDALLSHGDEDTLTEALDHLFNTHGQAYDELADFVEFRVESGLRRYQGKEAVLLAAPLLAWSRFRIPACSIAPAVLANLRVHLQAHVLAEGVRFALADFIFSPDQLPRGYCGTAEFADLMAQTAQADQDFHVDPKALPETTQFLSDTRYLLAVVLAEPGAPLFRWQEPDGNREQALKQWRAQGGACLSSLLPGCALEPLLPETYFAACREADRSGRAYSVRASTAFLSAALSVPAANLRAVVAPFHDRKLEEFRIGFTRRGEDDVVHGVVWPLLGAEDDGAEVETQIESVLQECGISDVVMLEHPFPLEYCEDCGAPLYPSPEGEVVHAEMPEEQADQIPRHLH